MKTQKLIEFVKNTGTPELLDILYEVLNERDEYLKAIASQVSRKSGITLDDAVTAARATGELVKKTSKSLIGASKSLWFELKKNYKEAKNRDTSQ